MHKYQPRLHIVICEEETTKPDPFTLIESFTTELVREFVFTETQFMAVTAYQNHRVSQLGVVIVDQYTIYKSMSYDKIHLFVNIF